MCCGTKYLLTEDGSSLISLSQVAYFSYDHNTPAGKGYIVYAKVSDDTITLGRCNTEAEAQESIHNLAMYLDAQQVQQAQPARQQAVPPGRMQYVNGVPAPYPPPPQQLYQPQPQELPRPGVLSWAAIKPRQGG